MQDSIKWALKHNEIVKIINELEYLLKIAKEKEQRILNDEQVLILQCGEKRISIDKGSKVEVDSIGFSFNGEYIEGESFGRPNTKKYNLYKEKLISKYGDKIYKII